MIYIATIS